VISQTAEYALRAVVVLGSNPDRSLTTQQIATRTQVPASYLSKVLQALGRAGLLEAQRGLGGGFSVTRPLDELTVLDVINAVDPLKRLERCPLGLVEHKRRMCALHRRLDAGIALIESHFGQTTIAQLLGEDTPNRPLCETEASTVDRTARRARGGNGHETGERNKPKESVRGRRGHRRAGTAARPRPRGPRPG
jgi:Rrf2 family protein